MNVGPTSFRKQVAVVRATDPAYPTMSPYHPSSAYPEYPFPDGLAEDRNVVYEGVRTLFWLLGLDGERFGRKEWNPLGHLIEPGMTVVLKPNFVVSRHLDNKNVYAAITHPAVLRAVGDYCWIALRGQGKLIIADSPQYDCNFEELLTTTSLREVVNHYGRFRGPQVTVYDLRDYWSRWKHFASLLEPLPGDPQGSLTVNLGSRSALYGKSHPERAYGAVYHRRETIDSHNGERQEYQVSRTVMNADVVISVPKLKVHKKVGVTLNIKGLVGITTNKNCLVHYTLTPPSKGGDQYPDGLFSPVEERLIRTERWMYDHFLAPRKRALEYLHRSIYALHNNSTRRLGLKVSEEKRLLDAGNWYGNDSAWRMAVDLYKAFCFSDPAGNVHATPQRRMFSIVDGIIGGDVNGPLAPDPVPAGILLAGDNFLAVDIVATRLMGFDPLKVRMHRELLKNTEFDFEVHTLDDIEVLSPDPSLVDCLTDLANRFLAFDPHPGWIGHLEIQPKREMAGGQHCLNRKLKNS